MQKRITESLSQAIILGAQNQVVLCYKERHCALDKYIRNDAECKENHVWVYPSEGRKGRREAER